MLSPKIRQARRARSKSLVMGEQSRSPGRPLVPHKLGPVLKAGWLRKQRSIMKNWQQRWFVLRGDQLFYYKDKDESKPQGFISLQGTQVTELLPDPEDPGKHLFEITPGGATEREKVPANPEALLLMASSQRDMEDWVQAIRRVIWAPLGRGTSRSSHVHPVKPLSAGNLVLLPHTHKFPLTWDLLDTSCMSDGSLVPLLLFLESCLPPGA